MSGQSLGLIETIGLAAAVEAADAAMKSANVKLVGYELTKGGGMVTVKFEGEVGAVKAAVAAAVAAANRVGQVYAQKVIARTAQYIDGFIRSADTVGPDAVEPVEPEIAQPQSLNIPVVNMPASPVAEAEVPKKEPETPKAEPAAPVNEQKTSRPGSNKKR